jgi:hypothetical protein
MRREKRCEPASEDCPHVEHNRIASEKRKTARAPLECEEPWTRGSHAVEQTPKRDRPEAWQPRAAQRGRQVLKGTKPQERRPITTTPPAIRWTSAPPAQASENRTVDDGFKRD